jgi:hypothetical protein
MAQETLPQLSESLIRGMASGASFGRQKLLPQQGDPRPRPSGDELRAECEGSQYEPYQVSVT